MSIQSTNHISTDSKDRTRVHYHTFSHVFFLYRTLSTEAGI